MSKELGAAPFSVTVTPEMMWNESLGFYCDIAREGWHDTRYHEDQWIPALFGEISLSRLKRISVHAKTCESKWGIPMVYPFYIPDTSGKS
jgi:hypothetical protein